MADLSGRVALVTGASRGFGRAAALALGAAGAHVVAVARTQGGLEELDDEIKAAGGAATLVPLDIADDAGLERLGGALYERVGRVDVWLHTAVYAPPLSPVEHLTEKALDRAISVNVRCFQRLIRVIDPLLRQAPLGRALIAADPDTLRPRSFHGLYAMSKVGQLALASAWAAETRGRIAVTLLHLPPMATAVRARFYPGEDPGRLDHPTEPAERLTLWLQSDAAQKPDIQDLDLRP